MSTCDLEGFCKAGDVLNKSRGGGDGANPGLRFLWAEEKARCSKAGLSSAALQPPASPSCPFFDISPCDLWRPSPDRAEGTDVAPSDAAFGAAFADWLGQALPSPQESASFRLLDGKGVGKGADVQGVSGQFSPGILLPRRPALPGPVPYGFHPMEPHEDELRQPPLAVDESMMAELLDGLGEEGVQRNEFRIPSAPSPLPLSFTQVLSIPRLRTAVENRRLGGGPEHGGRGGRGRGRRGRQRRLRGR